MADTIRIFNFVVLFFLSLQLSMSVVLDVVRVDAVCPALATTLLKLMQQTRYAGKGTGSVLYGSCRFNTVSKSSARILRFCRSFPPQPSFSSPGLTRRIPCGLFTDTSENIGVFLLLVFFSVFHYLVVAF